MIKRIAIDNYKCFSNFEYRPERLQLIMGRNGTGKSTLFEVLCALRNFAGLGLNPDQVFPSSSLTRWRGRQAQEFVLEIESKGGRFEYRLLLSFPDSSYEGAKVNIERLTYNGANLFFREKDDCRVSRTGLERSLRYLVSPRQSALFLLEPRDEDHELKWFKDWIASLSLIHIDPRRMKGSSDQDEVVPVPNFSNYVSWYRYLARHHSKQLPVLFDSLKQVIHGFSSMTLAKSGEDWVDLTIEKAFVDDGNNASSKVSFSLNELSDGQRVLIALYTVLHFGMESGTTLLIDEPTNHVSLREIQPWLMELERISADNDCQVFVASHHPEIINALAREHGVLFTREEDGSTRVGRFESIDLIDMSAA
ncbi:MAG: AAA family ATPase, partial [Planctomycetota bacterium]|nr:AAA family ATPase [Planctomycetota bacterium]